MKKIYKKLGIFSVIGVIFIIGNIWFNDYYANILKADIALTTVNGSSSDFYANTILNNYFIWVRNLLIFIYLIIGIVLFYPKNKKEN